MIVHGYDIDPDALERAWHSLPEKFSHLDMNSAMLRQGVNYMAINYGAATQFLQQQRRRRLATFNRGTGQWTKAAS